MAPGQPSGLKGAVRMDGALFLCRSVVAGRAVERCGELRG